MARMIPSVMDDVTPPGERQVFTYLASAPAAWVCIHSLDLAPWRRLLRTEIDFFVIVPEVGFLCLEVKSHPTISLIDDRWYPPTLKRSPFKQAADARYAFSRRLSEVAPTFMRVPACYCCVFTESPFNIPPNLSVQPWELIDGRRFQALRSAAHFAEVVTSKMQECVDADPRSKPLVHPLTSQQVDEVVSLCLPVQRNRSSQREEIDRRATELERVLREQQKPALLLAALNERVIVSGSAGTGKTLIAMEVALRAAQRHQRVGLICYNRLVSEWLKERVRREAAGFPNLVVDRAFRLLAIMAEISIPEGASSAFWADELLDLVENRLTDPEFSYAASFDYLVVDEGQDLLSRPRLWNCLTQCLVGGIERGGFALFGDFEHQVLGERGAMKSALTGIEGVARPARWELKENCRNYRIIGETAGHLSGFKSALYTGYMRGSGSIQDFNIHFYSSPEEQVEVLREWLREFRNARYFSGEIVVLSFCRPDKSAAACLRKTGYGLVEAWSARDGVRYTSVHAFKGLEAKVVILTDVALNGPDFQRDLFYTGMTRATEVVRILCSLESREQLTAWITEATT
jgi:hypothetical protein